MVLIAMKLSGIWFRFGALLLPRARNSEKYSLAGLEGDLWNSAFIHEQPDVDLEVGLEELGIIKFKQSDKFDPDKGFTTIHITM